MAEQNCDQPLAHPRAVAPSKSSYNTGGTYAIWIASPKAILKAAGIR
jgi:hypothetical protein